MCILLYNNDKTSDTNRKNALINICERYHDCVGRRPGDCVQLCDVSKDDLCASLIDDLQQRCKKHPERKFLLLIHKTPFDNCINKIFQKLKPLENRFLAVIFQGESISRQMGEELKKAAEKAAIYKPLHIWEEPFGMGGELPDSNNFRKFLKEICKKQANQCPFV